MIMSATRAGKRRKEEDMAMTDEILGVQRMNKGSYRGYVRGGSTLKLYFSSPTGDESDSVVLQMECESAEQAAEIAEMHQQVWGLSF
jgi:hypothetical protein